MNKLLIALLLFNSTFAYSQTVKGKVADNVNSAVAGATVSWVGKPQTAVISDENGMFTINKIQDEDRLAFSFMGFKSDFIYHR
jgi:hypothetical protein